MYSFVQNLNFSLKKATCLFKKFFKTHLLTPKAYLSIYPQPTYQ